MTSQSGEFYFRNLLWVIIFYIHAWGKHKDKKKWFWKRVEGKKSLSCSIDPIIVNHFVLRWVEINTRMTVLLYVSQRIAGGIKSEFMGWKKLFWNFEFFEGENWGI